MKIQGQSVSGNGTAGTKTLYEPGTARTPVGKSKKGSKKGRE